ncbi:hypothetical protein HPP92_023063 [Vanilla planifolia]|uniref:Uncharacterized protein n=1 Tax=Vanilla planifolia TaxID=51239 RepID=A0A835PT41_VANPL|nr:hypothetical protein HPP92_023063 [Vanilla planifolia]
MLQWCGFIVEACSGGRNEDRKGIRIEGSGQSDHKCSSEITFINISGHNQIK